MKVKPTAVAPAVPSVLLMTKDIPGAISDKETSPLKVAESSVTPKLQTHEVQPVKVASDKIAPVELAKSPEIQTIELAQAAKIKTPELEAVKPTSQKPERVKLAKTKAVENIEFAQAPNLETPVSETTPESIEPPQVEQPAKIKALEVEIPKLPAAAKLEPSDNLADPFKGPATPSRISFVNDKLREAKQLLTPDRKLDKANLEKAHILFREAAADYKAIILDTNSTPALIEAAKDNLQRVNELLSATPIKASLPETVKLPKIEVKLDGMKVKPTAVAPAVPSVLLMTEDIPGAISDKETSPLKVAESSVTPKLQTHEVQPVKVASDKIAPVELAKSPEIQTIELAQAAKIKTPELEAVKPTSQKPERVKLAKTKAVENIEFAQAPNLETPVSETTPESIEPPQVEQPAKIKALEVEIPKLPAAAKLEPSDNLADPFKGPATPSRISFVNDKLREAKQLLTPDRKLDKANLEKAHILFREAAADYKAIILDTNSTPALIEAAKDNLQRVNELLSATPIKASLTETVKLPKIEVKLDGMKVKPTAVAPAVPSVLLMTKDIPGAISDKETSPLKVAGPSVTPKLQTHEVQPVKVASDKIAPVELAKSPEIQTIELAQAAKIKTPELEAVKPTSQKPERVKLAKTKAVENIEFAQAPHLETPVSETTPESIEPPQVEQPAKIKALEVEIPKLPDAAKLEPSDNLADPFKGPATPSRISFVNDKLREAKQLLTPDRKLDKANLEKAHILFREAAADYKAIILDTNSTPALIQAAKDNLQRVNELLSATPIKASLTETVKLPKIEVKLDGMKVKPTAVAPAVPSVLLMTKDIPGAISDKETSPLKVAGPSVTPKLQTHEVQPVKVASDKIAPVELAQIEKSPSIHKPLKPINT